LRDVSFRRLKVDRSPDFDEYGHGQMRGLLDQGFMTIQGWAVGKDSLPVGVELRDEYGDKIADVAIDQPRPDIARMLPDVQGASTAGFRVSLRPGAAGPARVQLLVAFENGKKRELGSVSCEVQGDLPTNGNWSVVRENEKVLVGKQGWLFLHGDTNDILGQHTGKVKMGVDRTARWHRVLEGRIATSKNLGIPWHCIVAPDKEAIYPEYLPDHVVPSARRPIHEFLAAADSLDAPVTYPLDRFQAAKQEDELYARTDTHWNYWGAYLVYRMFCEELVRLGVGLNLMEEAELLWFEEMIEGDLGRKVRPEPKSAPTILVKLKDPESGIVFDNGVTNHGRVRCFERERPGPKCVLFGESFSDYLLPFLRESFQRVVFVHTSMFVSEVLERERPDAVLSLPTERFLIRVPDDTDAFAELRALAARKGGDLPWAT
jgi:alginate O-acetyltransferase complex protein AlgJ